MPASAAASEKPKNYVKAIKETAPSPTLEFKTRRR